MMKIRLIVAVVMLAGLSSCITSRDAGYHRQRVEEWDNTIQTDLVTGKQFHSGDIHYVPDYTAPSQEE